MGWFWNPLCTEKLLPSYLMRKPGLIEFHVDLVPLFDLELVVVTIELVPRVIPRYGALFHLDASGGHCLVQVIRILLIGDRRDHHLVVVVDLGRMEMGPLEERAGRNRRPFIGAYARVDIGNIDLCSSVRRLHCTPGGA